MPCSIRNLFWINLLPHGTMLLEVISSSEPRTWNEAAVVHIFPYWHLYMKLNPKRIVFVFLFSLPLCLPSHFFAYLCCSLCLSWSGKSEVIGFWIKESKQEWKQALIHFTLSGMMGWQATLGSSSKRAFTLNFLRKISSITCDRDVSIHGAPGPRWHVGAYFD